jgi:hypothetical protein
MQEVGCFSEVMAGWKYHAHEMITAENYAANIVVGFVVHRLQDPTISSRLHEVVNAPWVL